MRIRLSFIALLLSISSAVTWGQGLVDGTVVNGNQFAGVPGKTVHLVNNTTKPPIDRIAVTDDQGYYSFENVAPGDGYSVEVLSDTGKPLGFDLALHFSIVGDRKHTALPNIDIAKGVSADEASKATGLIVNDITTAQGANVSNEQLRELPLYNRTFLALGLLQPGVHDVEQGSPLQGAAFSIAGSRATSTNFLLNSLEITESAGVDNVASSNNQAIPFQVNEAVQDFRVIYATPELRYGQGSGGVIDVVTSQSRLSAKGGLGAWHGSAFGYFNNDSLNSGSPLSAYSNSGFFKAAAYACGSATPCPYNSLTASPTYNQITFPGAYAGYAPQTYNELQSLLGNVLDLAHATSISQAGQFNSASVLSSQNSFTLPVTQTQFGASAGGPMFAGKLLLFASYEGTIVNNPTPIFERVPTFLDRTGLPSTLSAGDSGIAQGILALFPSPNVGQTGSTLTANGNAGVFGFYRGTAPNYTHVHNINVRPDIPLGTKGTISLRYTAQLLNQLHDDTLPSGGAYPGNGAFRKAQNQNAAITYNRLIGKHTNVLNLGFTQFRVDEIAQDKNFNAAPFGFSQPAGLSTLVISGIDTQTTSPKTGQLGKMGGWSDSFWQTAANPTSSPSPITPSLDGDFPLARIGAPLSAPSAHRDSEAFGSDLIELQLGSHNQLSAGADYRYQQNFSYDAGLTRGLVVSNNIGEFTGDSETCISCSPSLAFTKPSFDYELRQPAPYIGDLRSSSVGVFAENKFQATDRLVFTAGFRYDYFGEPLDTQGRLWNYNNGAQGLVRQGAKGTYDAFDYQCGGVTSALDSLYSARRVGFPTGWNCSNSSFSLPSDKRDLTGRLGFSYSPGQGNKNVLKAAIGGYYDHLPASYNQKLLQNRPSPFSPTNPSAIYGQNFDSAACGPAGVASQCGFGLHTLNLSGEANDTTFQNYQAASGANVLYERDPGELRTPYSVQFSASFQHEFSNSWNAELAFVGSEGHRLPLVWDSNFNNEFYCTQGGPSTAPGGLCNNNTFFPVFTQSNIGVSNYTSLVARVNSQQWHGLSLHVAYTYAKSLDDIASSDFPQTVDSLWSQLFGRQLLGMGNPVAFALGANGFGVGNDTRSNEIGTSASIKNRQALATGGNIPSFNAVQSALTTTGSRPITVSHYNIPQNPLAFSSTTPGLGGDYGPSDFDVRSRAVADFVYAIPDGGHKWANGFLVSGVFVGQSGQPFSIFSGPAYGQVTQRVSAVAGTPIRVTKSPTGYFSGISSANLVSVADSTQAVNPCPSLYAQGPLFTGTPVAPYACSGSTGRNSFTGPGFVSQDLAIQKTTRIYGENQNFVVRAEFFNLFNRANYYNPISEFSLDGVHVNPEFGLIRSAHDPRQIQLAARYTF